MTEKFQPGKAKTYFSSNFLKNHVFVGRQGQKKEAERVFQRRGKRISTVICLTSRELVSLAAEVHERQEEYGSKPRGHYKTRQKVDHMVRGGTTASSRQRAKPGCAKFVYGVRRQRSGRFVMCHFERLG